MTKSPAQLDAEIAESLAARQSGPPATDTEILINRLGDAGVTISNASTGAIRLPNGDVAFVRSSNGKIIVSHPPKGGRAQTYRQTFTNFDRALKGIQAHIRFGKTSEIAAARAPAIPKLIAKRARDFRDSGNYEVRDESGALVALMFRDPENREWYEDSLSGEPQTHYTQRWRGGTQAEAIANIAKRRGRLA